MEYYRSFHFYMLISILAFSKNQAVCVQGNIFFIQHCNELSDGNQFTFYPVTVGTLNDYKVTSGCQRNHIIRQIFWQIQKKCSSNVLFSYTLSNSSVSISSLFLGKTYQKVPYLNIYP